MLGQQIPGLPAQTSNPAFTGFSWISDLLTGQPVGRTKSVVEGYTTFAERLPAQFAAAQEEVSLYAKAQLTLQVVSTAALVAMFLLALSRNKKG
jgi:hypothetical protein